jgi:D-sedoheptulose 7-phosphate isomerase
MTLLKAQFAEHRDAFLSLESLSPQIEAAAQTIKESIQSGKKILICGNGGSAADAQHFAAELIGHFVKERQPLPAIALTTDTSALTAIGNDYSFENIFARQIQAFGQSGDVLIAISTSGNSKNVIKAAQMAYEKGLLVIFLTGQSGGLLNHIAQDPSLLLKMPSPIVSRIQECHIFILHCFCQILDG